MCTYIYIYIYQKQCSKLIWLRYVVARRRSWCPGRWSFIKVMFPGKSMGFDISPPSVFPLFPYCSDKDMMGIIEYVWDICGIFFHGYSDSHPKKPEYPTYIPHKCS